MPNQRVHIIVSGRVQGVGFRYFIQQNATEIGLTGWVRNQPNRNVEIIAEGTQSQIEQFLAICKQGPTGSRVDNTDIKSLTATGEFKDFSIKRFF